ncbi:MAG: L-histidine N(alpha)-methyltransferase, partial [Bryobacteraceae bacterium]|nr:L-histidine N(alpha)-methyltransferase [Bryobacteraceae bacterium]
MRLSVELEFAQEVRRGLTSSPQKTLPTRYLYDEVGSALFDAITALPEYGLTNADVRLLTVHSSEIEHLCAGVTDVVELGSGNGTKTRVILTAFPPAVTYRPVDISAAALERCTREMHGFRTIPVEADFLSGLDQVSDRRPTDGHMLTLFLGSNIGNFNRHEIIPFLTAIRQRLRTGDYFLIGADLIKPADQLILAYDDPAGVTAAFNRNLLARVNRQLEGNFHLQSYDHQALWNSPDRRIEMHLLARSDQNVRLGAID